jgi:hypothetical protein
VTNRSEASAWSTMAGMVSTSATASDGSSSATSLRIAGTGGRSTRPLPVQRSVSSSAQRVLPSHGNAAVGTFV